MLIAKGLSLDGQLAPTSFDGLVLGADGVITDEPSKVEKKFS